MEMTTPEEILLSAAAEMGNWARHYDSARFQLTALILALSGAAVSYAISTHDNRVRMLLLVVTACVGFSLSVASAEYSRLYYERSSAAFQLRKLATQYQSLEKERSNFSRHKVSKKIHEAYFEAFDESGPLVEDLDDAEAAKIMKDNYGRHGVWYWRWYMFPRVASSVWVWLNFGVGFFLPISCLVLGIRREPRER